MRLSNNGPANPTWPTSLVKDNPVPRVLRTSPTPIHSSTSILLHTVDLLKVSVVVDSPADLALVAIRAFHTVVAQGEAHRQDGILHQDSFIQDREISPLTLPVCQ
jgi:hypothetical protein